jgi:hypothetical protein
MTKADDDIGNLSIDDIRKIENATIRSALMGAATRRGDLAAAHQNHGSHSDSNTSPTNLRVEFVKAAVSRNKS